MLPFDGPSRTNKDISDIVILSGEVDIMAYVEDPTTPGRLLSVQVVTAGSGSIIGDLERVRGSKKYMYHVLALTDVETAEMSVEQFSRNIFSNQHAAATSKLLTSGAEEKHRFHSRRIGLEMRRFAETVRQMQENKQKQRADFGGPADKLKYIKGEWEKEFAR